MKQADLEHRYYQYLYSKGYSSPTALEEVLRHYLPYFQGFKRVLDIGCGHGEFLKILADAGHEVVGVDIDPAMVKKCQEQGFVAYEADAITWLPQQAEQFDAIFSSNVIEHLEATTVMQLIHAAYAALRPGGLLFMTTPNSESVIVQFYEFWRDPTHVRLYHRQLIEFFYHDAGFTQIQSVTNPTAYWSGIDQMLAPWPTPAITLPIEKENLLAGPLPPAHIADLNPLPPPPEPGASLRRRLAYQVANFVFKKFFEPYLEPLRHDLARQQTALAHLQNNLNLMQQQAYQTTEATRIHWQEAVAALKEVMDTKVALRFQQLGDSYRFLYPSREIVVSGIKPPTSTGV